MGSVKNSGSTIGNGKPLEKAHTYWAELENTKYLWYFDFLNFIGGKQSWKLLMRSISFFIRLIPEEFPSFGRYFHHESSTENLDQLLFSSPKLNIHDLKQLEHRIRLLSIPSLFPQSLKPLHLILSLLPSWSFFMAFLANDTPSRRVTHRHAITANTCLQLSTYSVPTLYRFHFPTTLHSAFSWCTPSLSLWPLIFTFSFDGPLVVASSRVCVSRIFGVSHLFIHRVPTLQNAYTTGKGREAFVESNSLAQMDIRKVVSVVSDCGCPIFDRYAYPQFCLSNFFFFFFAKRKDV